ncbi:MAG: alpha/beta hydrolase [Candidatus Babeliaceae bacterium]|nr:alpha/beta hydrolase [Candidatus Babeliaceae bacterium]
MNKKVVLMIFLTGAVIIFISLGMRFYWDIKNIYTRSIASADCKDKEDFEIKKQSKLKKYHNNGKVEHIIFSVPNSRGSQKMILRKGILVTRPGARATIVICHGFMCNKNDVSFLRSIFYDYNVMVFDFRAHGENIEDQCSSFGVNEVLDLEGAVAFVKSKPELSKLPLIAYGFSMGAVTAILTQAQHPDMFSALILDCPFDSTEMVIHRLIEKLTFSIGGYQWGLPGRGLLKKYAYHPSIQAIVKLALKTVAHVGTHDIVTCILPSNTVQEVQKVTVPTFFITCKNDDKAPIEAVRSIYLNKPGYKRLWLTSGRNHFDSFFYNPEKYTHKVRSFIKSFLDNELKNKVTAKIVEDMDDPFVHKEIL